MLTVCVTITNLQAWFNEKFSPELLEAKTDLVDCMLEQISEMEENIARAKKGDFKVSLHRMEVSPSELNIRCVKLISVDTVWVISSPNPMFDHL